MSNDPSNHNPYGFSPQSMQTTSPNNPPTWPSEPPKVVFWAKVYNGAMIILYLALSIGGGFLIAFANELTADSADTGPMEMTIMGVIYLVMGAILTIVFSVAFVWRKGTGAWIYQMIMIIIGLTSCCTWPATIPLLVYWIRDRDRILHN
jgi:nitrate reductase NapE component